MKNDLVIYIDFDETLFNTPAFAKDLWRLISIRSNESETRVAADAKKFFADLSLGGYDYEAHVESYGLDESKMWNDLEKPLSKNNYLYNESPVFIQSLVKGGYQPHILSFGEKRFQSLKIQPRIEKLVGKSNYDLSFHVVMQKKNIFISENHPGQIGVLIDDKPGQDLPDGFVEITINHSKMHNIEKLSETKYLVSNLSDAEQVIRQISATRR